MIPRIRGRAGVAQEGPHCGKWFYEITIWDLSGEHQAGEPIQIGPFENEDQAYSEGMKAVRLVSETAETMHGGEPSGKYLDMKNGGVLRPWENNS